MIKASVGSVRRKEELGTCDDNLSRVMTPALCRAVCRLTPSLLQPFTRQEAIELFQLSLVEVSKEETPQISQRCENGTCAAHLTDALGGS